MSKQEEIRVALEAAFAPHALDVINESHLHASHAGDDGSGESHFRVKIAAEVFGNMSRVARHRAVHAALGKDLVNQIHALALEISA